MLTSPEQKNTLPVATSWLTSRTFTFKVEGGPVLSEQFLFHRNGFIVGYNHKNEMFWESDGDGINILDQDGRITCSLYPQAAPGSSARFSGFFRDPANNYETTRHVHVIEENGSDYHTGIQSFDLFDTLVARRCFDPLAVFRAVERKSGVANFADLRHRMEMRMFGHRPYGLDDIYEALVSYAFLTERQAKVLKLMELEEEWDTLFPISEIVARVNPGDIVISDMYLPKPFVERILKEKCGLDNKLYLSNYGKHHRKIWPIVQSEYKLRAHFGDNIQADIISPASFNIPVHLVNISKWDRTEEILHDAGLSLYAHTVRETRLQTFHSNVHIHNAMQAQVSINIPLMILGTFWVKLCAAKHGADKILMAARDCNLWHELLSSRHFAQLGMPSSSYIRISRSVCYPESIEYEAYLQHWLGQRSLLVDFVGTGRSLGTIIDRMGRRDAITPCVLVGEPRAIDTSGSFPETLILKDFHKYRIFFEALNASHDGSAVQTIHEDFRLKVLMQDNEFSPFARTIISEMRATFRRFLQNLDQLDASAELPAIEALQSAADAVAELLPAWAAKLATLQNEQKNNLMRGNPLSAVNVS